MGRGRQKAKHTKVARELKYYSPETNYAALERELSHPNTDVVTESRYSADDDDDDQGYANWSDER
ncbi:Protein of unknown function (DUF3073) [Sediminihabitans luteus]|uniref:DUF3073 family protein n=1 Tax=Sediminihabitans luteus TaxID=1138585 RepID=A0A2M9D083_9CELL|nr:DUF3073 domain-containing protein [Sediminihabitans luteus]PJJ77604.1 Protein of unknown function (DUF3073) [Sediminihabitans luteus]GII98504.1 hypothetical protein Slu03_08820 [Sediminihabitans luteus]